MSSAAGGSPPRVLIAEDDPHTRRINALALSFAGCETRDVGEGASAIRVALEWRPDLLVIDLAMPGVGGLAAIAEIKGRLGTEAPRVIVLTARAMHEDRQAAQTAGCDVFLAKPIDPFDLVHEVRRLLAGKAGAP